LTHENARNDRLFANYSASFSERATSAFLFPRVSLSHNGLASAQAAAVWMSWWEAENVRGEKFETRNAF
jgi:hypothetical protein